MPENLEKTVKIRNGLAPRLLDIFIIANLVFLALDVFIAHSVNGFAHWAEWIPFYFSLGAPILLVFTVLGTKKPWTHGCRLGVGWSAICIGVAGMLFHLNSHFFSDLTLRSLIYTAPFVAPLAFTGLGLLLIMNGSTQSQDVEWGQWVVFLAGCGWFGNFILSVFDHAQNGFFNPLEWLPVFTSAIAVGCLVTVVLIPNPSSFFKFCLVVLGVNFIVGIAGFYFHFVADLQAPTVAPTDGFLYGAPLFAPLLFPNLSLLAILGIWQLSNRS